MISKKKRTIAIVILLIFGLSIGYAFLNTSLNINGTSKISGNNWNIHFDNLYVNPDSVVLSTGDVSATINSSNTTEVTYTVTLDKPGDFYEFEVDAVNSGTIDGMIESVVSKVNGLDISNLPNYLDYKISYEDGIPIEDNHLLKAGESVTYKVRLEFKKDIQSSDLLSSADSLALTLEIDYIQSDGEATPRPLPNYYYNNGSWNTYIGAEFDSSYFSASYEEYMANNGFPFIVRYEEKDDYLVAAFVGYTINNKIYYLKGACVEYVNGQEIYYDISPFYSKNKNILQDSFGVENCSEDSDLYSNFYHCEGNGYKADVYQTGVVYIEDCMWFCRINSGGDSMCTHLMNGGYC